MPSPIGRGESCPYCYADLHVCKNCRHYSTAAYNDCLETQAERVLEKEKANFCDYFAMKDKSGPVGVSPQEAAKAKLEDLFKKK